MADVINNPNVPTIVSGQTLVIISRLISSQRSVLPTNWDVIMKDAIKKAEVTAPAKRSCQFAANALKIEDVEDAEDAAVDDEGFELILSMEGLFIYFELCLILLIQFFLTNYVMVLKWDPYQIL